MQGSWVFQRDKERTDVIPSGQLSQECAKQAFDNALSPVRTIDTNRSVYEARILIKGPTLIKGLKARNSMGSGDMVFSPQCDDHAVGR